MSELCGAFMAFVNGTSSGMYCNAAKGHLGPHSFTFESYLGGAALAEKPAERPQLSAEPQQCHSHFTTPDGQLLRCQNQHAAEHDIHESGDWEWKDEAAAPAAPPVLQVEPRPTSLDKYNVIGCAGGEHCICKDGWGHKKFAQTPIPVPLASKSKEELVRIVEMMQEDLQWYVDERNKLLRALADSPVSGEKAK